MAKLNNWEVNDPDKKCEGTTRIILGCLRYKAQIQARTDHVPFPQNCCCFTFQVKEEQAVGLRLPAKLLLQLWDEHEHWTGTCAACGEDAVYGIGCGGLLSTGGVVGYCTHCHVKNFRFVGGLARMGIVLKEQIQGSIYDGYHMTYGSGSSVNLRRPIYLVLRDLGYDNLPPESWLDEDTPAIPVLKMPKD